MNVEPDDDDDGRGAPLNVAVTSLTLLSPLPSVIAVASLSPPLQTLLLLLHPIGIRASILIRAS